ncbi:type II toxin-antitoxin system RelE/ParE family toxin [Pseudomonas putida]|uniref:type II toxin-antitoxin system RelE/ParE family toxin n=1 Tax=Pseudomonas putida TaxID=303 RepID=UPI003132F087
MPKLITDLPASLTIKGLFYFATWATVDRCAVFGDLLITLTRVGAGAIELIINGSPAFRRVYVAKFADMVVVLHSFVKTTNRSDRHAMQVAEERMKELKQELRKMGYRV